MRRKHGVLIPLEVAILEAAVDLRQRGVPEAHGFRLAKEVRDERKARRLTAYGTLYKALDRLERSGLLESRWEDPLISASEGRPRRRLYRVTLAGDEVLAQTLESAAPEARPRPAAALAS